MIKAAGFRVVGESSSGVGTVICLPDLKIAFDMGICTREALKCQTVFITHPHIDHIAGIVRHAAIRHLIGAPPSQFVVRPSLVKPLGEIFEIWGCIQNQRLDHNFVQLEPGESWRFHQDWVVRPFSVDHKIPAQGYGLWRSHKKLKPEFQGIPEAKIRRLVVEEGVDVSETLERLEVAYTGDTVASSLDQETVRKARLLITEATFVGEETSDEFAEERGHTHLRQIVEREHSLENEAIVLMHFSARYCASEVRKALGDLPESLRNRVQALTDGLKE